MRDLIVICGATASGKSAVAVELCKRIGGEVISCDSMQLYRGMDIGTATLTIDEMAGVSHHLISVIDPDTPCSAASYREMALPVIEDVLSRGRVPVLCGGTGLYINALTRPLGFSVKGDAALRMRLEAAANEVGGREALHARLGAIDPASAMRLHPNDVRRVIRALEVHVLTGRTLTEQMALDRERPGDFCGRLFAVDWPRDALYARIDRRVDEMMAQGLEREVLALRVAGIDRSATAMQAIGYKELAAHLDGECTIAEAIEAVKQGTRRYAKRQLTWFRGDERTRWVEGEGRGAPDIAREIIESLEEKREEP